MSSGFLLQQYIESLENLPNELSQNFLLMRELDQKAKDVMQSIDQKSDEYLKSALQLSQEKKSEQMSAFQKMFNTAKEYYDDKIHLSVRTYELVDKHIRRLDADLAKFEAEIKDKNSTKENEVPCVNNRKKKLQEKVKLKKRSSDEEEAVKKGRKKMAVEAESVLCSVLPVHSVTHPSDVLDMPVDPNEPTYCLCHQVSCGGMIACDGADCPIEWFHFACVGLTIKPKGRWYCPRCMADRKKK